MVGARHSQALTLNCRRAAAWRVHHPRFVRCLFTKPVSRLGRSTGATFALIYKQQQRRLTAIEMLRFFDWSYRTGAKLADELQYVPMPKDVVEMIESAWVDVMDAQGRPAWMDPATAKH